jgi:3-hydroxyacyl-CoA dehydrogenase
MAYYKNIAVIGAGNIGEPIAKVLPTSVMHVSKLIQIFRHLYPKAQMLLL